MRLKDTDELIKLIDDDIASLDNSRMPQIAYNECLCTLRMVKQYIKALPTIEAETTKHGRWINEQLASTSGGSYSVVRCSVCKAQFPMYKTNYCPNCGARMDK